MFPAIDYSLEFSHQDNLLYINKKASPHYLKWDNFFSSSQPIFLEYCTGNGAWIVEQALKYPLINWVAVEIKKERVEKIWRRAKKEQVKNLLIICSEAYQLSKDFIEKNSITKIFINFPDPWPKRRHAKYRLITPNFIEILEKILITQENSPGEVILVTDDLNYSEQMILTFQNNTSFHSKYLAPYFKDNLADYGSSFFEELWRSKGKEIRYHCFLKKV